MDKRRGSSSSSSAHKPLPRSRSPDRDRDRDRDRERDRSRRHRDRDRDRDRSPRHRRHRSPSPELHRKRHRHPDDRRRSSSDAARSPSLETPRKRHRRDDDPYRHDDDVRDRRHLQATAVSDFVDSIVKEQKDRAGSGEIQGVASGGGGGDSAEMDADENEMMKKMGIPVGFDSTKGKPVAGADVSGIRAVTKRQPRQYMNRRGGFNRPLPMERNR